MLYNIKKNNNLFKRNPIIYQGMMRTSLLKLFKHALQHIKQQLLLVPSNTISVDMITSIIKCFTTYKETACFSDIKNSSMYCMVDFFNVISLCDNVKTWRYVFIPPQKPKDLHTHIDAGDVVLNAHDHQPVGDLVREGHGPVHEGGRLRVAPCKNNRKFTV